MKSTAIRQLVAMATPQPNLPVWYSYVLRSNCCLREDGESNADNDKIILEQDCCRESCQTCCTQHKQCHGNGTAMKYHDKKLVTHFKV